MKGLAILAIVLMFSGCICCGGKDFSDITGGKSTADDVGVEDISNTDEGGGYDDVQADEVNAEEQPADVEEETTTTLESYGESTETTITQATVTTQPAVTTTVKPRSGTYECVRTAGFDPDKAYYGYSPDCGMKFKSDASMVSIRTGVDIQPFNLAIRSDEPGMRFLECFYGTYSPSNPAFGQCPMLFCPKTGEYKILSGQASASVSSQMSGFAKKCV
ncbi:MAG: hypothetical protein V1875_06150 [Candidatus Altiarchaeota archaeon]